MLQQLLDELSKTTSLLDKFYDLEERAKVTPQTTEQILDLLMLTKYDLTKENITYIDQSRIENEIVNCKQILIYTNDYFYI